MKKWGVCVICILLLCVIETVPVFASEKNTQDYLGNMTEELDFSKLDHFMRQDAEDSGITFSELVKELLYQEKPGALYQQIGPWLMGQLCESVCENRKILVEVVLLAVCFSVLKNFAGAFASSYVSDLCFILVFCVLAVLMLQSFLTFREIVCGVLEKSVDFFQIFIPTFSIAMLFSAGESIASGFYQTAFLIIYLIEWLFLTILVPMTGDVRRSAVYTTSSAVIFSPSDQDAFSSICTIKFLLSSVVTESAISPSNSRFEFNSTSGRNIRLVAYLLVSPPSIKSGFNVPSVLVTPIFTISSETSAVSVAAAFSPCG